MTDVNPVHADSLIRECVVPDTCRDTIHTYLQQVCEAGIAKGCMEGGDLAQNELLNHALGYAIYKRLPDDIRENINTLRGGKDKPVLVLRNLIPPPSASPPMHVESNDPNLFLLKGIGAMLGADYSPENTKDAYYHLESQKLSDRGPDLYHIDHGSLFMDNAGKPRARTQDRFSALLCLKDVPEASTTFVPLEESDRHFRFTTSYPDNPGEKAVLAAGDLVVFDNTRLLHARHDVAPDDQPRILLGGFVQGRDKSARAYCGNYLGVPDGRRFIERMAEHTLVSREGAKGFEDLLAQAQAAKQSQFTVR